MRIAAEACRDILLRLPCILLHLALSLAHAVPLTVCVRSQPSRPARAQRAQQSRRRDDRFLYESVWVCLCRIRTSRHMVSPGIFIDRSARGWPGVCIEVLDESAIRPRVAWRVVNRFDYQTLLIVCYTLAHRTTNKYMQQLQSPIYFSHCKLYRFISLSHPLFTQPIDSTSPTRHRPTATYPA